MLSTFGRIGQDAELRYTPNGTAVANISFVYDYGRKGDNGYKPSQWLEIAVWGKQAEGLAPYLTKGKQVSVSVRDVRIETFHKNDGTEGHKLVGDLADIKFASDGQQSQQPAPKQQRTAQNMPPQGVGQMPQQQSNQQWKDDFDDSDQPPF